MNCRIAYPTIVQLHKKYENRGLQTVFVTYIEGRLGQRDGVSVEEEVEYDRHHWLDQEKIPFPIAIVEPPMKSDGSGRERPYFMDTYVADGFPLYVLIDGRGIVRHIQFGHREDLEGSLTRAIEKGLQERSGGSD